MTCGLILAQRKWFLVQERKKCAGSNRTLVGHVKSIVVCAELCKQKSSMFTVGTNDYGKPQCDQTEPGCSCHCELSASKLGDCSMQEDNGVRLYSFRDPGQVPDSFFILLR